MKKDHHTVTLPRWELEELERKAAMLDALVVLEDDKPVLERIIGTTSDFNSPLMDPVPNIHKFMALRSEAVDLSEVRRIYIVDESDRVFRSYSLVPSGMMQDGVTIGHLTDFTQNNGGTGRDAIRSRKSPYEN